jgi:outer membrane protein assembly factor BamB
VLWQRAVAADPSTLATESAPRVAELAGGRLYVVYGKEYFDARLEALDAKTGQTAWDVPLVGSLPRHDAFGSRGDAVSVVVSESRVYVARSEGGLDVFDAKTGAAVGRIGK